MARQLNPGELIHAITTLTGKTIDIPIKNIQSRHTTIRRKIIRPPPITLPNTMAAEMATGVIRMRATRATPAALALRNMVRIAAADRPLPAPAAVPDHPQAPVPILRHPDLVLLRTHHPAQATARPEQAPVLRHSQLQRPQLQHRIQMPADPGRQNKRFTPARVEQFLPACSTSNFLLTPLFYTALRAERSHPGTETARSRSALSVRTGPESIRRRSLSRGKRSSSHCLFHPRRLLAREV